MEPGTLLTMDETTVTLILSKADADRLATCLTRLDGFVQAHSGQVGLWLEELEPDRPRTMSKERHRQFETAAFELGYDARRLLEQLRRVLPPPGGRP